MEFKAFQAKPKAEIHVHLEGAIRPDRVVQWVAGQPGHPWHGCGARELVTKFKMASFPEFIEAFMTGYKLLDSRTRFQQITEDLCAEFEEQGVVYAEVLYSPGVQIQHWNRSLKDIHNGIEAGLRHFPNLPIRFILDTVLNLGPAFIARTLQAVLADRREFISGFSVGGGVADLDIRPFLPLFETAQRAGLYCVAHVGEVDSAENVRVLVENTDVQRIAHGCAAAADPDALQLLKRRGITVDVCPTSNRFTGASDGYDPHPAAVFLKHDIPITINTDDPLYFGCHLFDEYQAAIDTFGLDSSQVSQIMAHGLSFADRNAGA